MRFLPAIALATGIAAALTSGPAIAADACPIERAIYTAKEAPSFTMHIKPTSRDKSDTRLQAVIYDGLQESMFAPQVAQLTFTYSMGYSVEYAIGTSSAIEASPGETPLRSRLLAFGPDFGATGISGGPGSVAPYALMIPDIGLQLYNATKHDRKRQTSIPEGAWILTHCR